MTIVWLITGLVVLAAGAELLVRGASSMARMLGVTPLVIGLTVVAMGTSTPEMVVSVIAAIEGRPNIAVGNVVGSSVFNILFVLGMSVVVAPAGVMVASSALSFDIPVMVAVSLACLP